MGIHLSDYLLLTRPKLRIMTQVYFVMLLGDLILIAMDFPPGRLITKPILMLVLLVALYGLRKEIDRSYFWIWAGALFFSWLGDIFLMGSETFFIPGLIGFLIAHLFYISLFLRWKPRERLSVRAFIWTITLTAVFFLYFYKIILSETGGLFGAVLIYAIVILSMWLLAAYRSLREGRYHVLILVGAGLFVLSDSLLGYGKFSDPAASLGVWVMFTYGLAQYFLFGGIYKVLMIKGKGQKKRPV